MFKFLNKPLVTFLIVSIIWACVFPPMLVVYWLSLLFPDYRNKSGRFEY